MTYLIAIDPGQIKPGMRLQRKVTAHGIIRTDDLVCAANEHGVIVNPRGYRLPHEGAEWFAYMSDNPLLSEAISVLAKALQEDAEPDDDKPRRLTPAQNIARVEKLIDQGWTLDEVVDEVGITEASLYTLLHRNKRDDLWQRIKHGRAA